VCAVADSHVRRSSNRLRRVSLAENDLIALLPQRDRGLLVAACQTVSMELGTVLCRQGDTARHVYFPNDCVISLVTALDSVQGVEVGMVGREGMLGAHVALGIGANPLHALVQGEGTARRIAVAPFRNALATSPGLRRAIHRYVYVMLAQFAMSSACTRFHNVAPRLARWLLMTQDRSHSDSFHLTHAFLARMLGVRRVGITGAAGGLQRRGLIRYRRGDITVCDRAGLEAAACSCYAADRQAYVQSVR
jgi:CRP-like cAMP-binding protein